MALTNIPSDNPASPLTLADLIEAHFDRELSSELQVKLDRMLERDPAAAMLFEQMKADSQALRLPVNVPDNTDAILAAVGHRRGWIGARLQRFVSLGRLGIAATFLLTIAAALAAKRFAPDAAIFPSTPTPLANVADCAADDANGGMNDLVAAVNSLGVSSQLTRVSRSMLAPDLISLHAGLTPAGFRTNSPTPPQCDASKPFSYTVRVMSLRDGSFRTLAGQQRVGSVVILVGSSSHRADAVEQSEKDPSVSGW